MWTEAEMLDVGLLNVYRVVAQTILGGVVAETTLLYRRRSRKKMRVAIFVCVAGTQSSVVE
jgi:hypothetical protein